ncbi:hypothetical protein [Maridesulfovibrio bastinii]|uniref:hypothetical protein n=1 Tax=Maridesulfovibrio bastinii TaxID=47157 RepID=UPI0004199B64|nr:hypothetical protein [Maridesulfovibrio bastinii]
MGFKDIEISDESAKAVGEAAGAIAGIIASGTAIAPLAPVISLIVTTGLKLTNAGYEVKGLEGLRKSISDVENLPDLTLE